MKDKCVLITGASSGIGEALAREVAREAKRLVLVARRTDRLEALAAELRRRHAGLEVRVDRVDLIDSEALEAFCTQRLPNYAVDVLINNAGAGVVGLYEKNDWAMVDRMLTLNVRSLARLTHAVLPRLVAQRSGGILNVSSGFGLTFSPGFAAYVGTKHFVSGLTESLRTELVGTGVVVSQVCPGPVATEFGQHTGTELKAPKAVEISAERCAREALAGFRRGQPIIIPAMRMRALVGLSQVAPRCVLRAFYSAFGQALRRHTERGTLPSSRAT